MFSLLRYKQDTDMYGQQRTIKINTVLTTGHKDGSNISLTLCGKQFYLQSVIFHQGIPDKNELYNYLTFLGAGVHSGHYTSMVKRGADWWYMNDQVVTKKDQTKAWKSSESFILFYTQG